MIFKAGMHTPCANFRLCEGQLSGGDCNVILSCLQGESWPRPVKLPQFYETLEVRGQSVAATRFRLTAYEVDLTIWYSADDEWLALESVAKGGHIIRYELS